MDTNEVIIISEEADGTTTIVDIVEVKDDANAATDSSNIVLEVLEAILDVDDNVTETTETTEEFVENADGVQVPITEIEETATVFVTEAESADTAFITESESADTSFITESESAETAFISESESAGAEFTSGGFATSDDAISSSDIVIGAAGDVEYAPGADVAASTFADTSSFVTDYAGTTATTSDSTTSETTEVDADAQANIAAATEAQAQADEAIAAGDFETAAQLRGDAEDYAYAANDDSMLHGSDSSDLGLADHQHDLADMKEQEVAEYTAAGDYDSARDAAADAATYQQWADGNAGSTVDHSEQTENQQAELEWADWHQDIAVDNQNSADAYAASGDLETAAIYQDSANDEQVVADDYGAASVYEATQDTSDATYDASYSAVDTAYDSSYSAVDTSYDSSYTSTDTSYDSE
jgi:hypothetical protein